MKCVIAGSRTIRDISIVRRALKEAPFFASVSEIVSGGALGVDALAEIVAAELDLPCTIFLPDWKTFGAAAGPIRNRQMAKYAEALVLIWDKKSLGSASMLREATRQNLSIWQVIHHGA